ncbi:MAG: response regulator transcription factor [Lachnospiraceae bacterium]|nr:response regulator transcription factor [Lachnospiraceae bacterium]
MDQILIIRLTDSDGTIYQTIIDALKDYSIQSVYATSTTVLTFGDIEIYPEQRKVIKSGKEIHLNYGEFSILYCMAQSPGHVFSRGQLYNAAWGEDYELGTNTVDNTIWRLRNKLEPDPKHPTYIKTVFRVGYKIEK